MVLQDWFYNLRRTFPGVRACSRVLGLFPRDSGLFSGPGFVSQESPTQGVFPFLQSTGHSVRRATTGSFLAALREGIIPEKSVSPVLMRIKIRATWGGRYALRVWIPVTL